MEIIKSTWKVLLSLIIFLFISSNILTAKDKDFPVTEYGAISGGKELSTLAIQKAIDAASLNGGGRVIIPDGVFLSGSIVLKSGVNLHLRPSSILLGSTNPRDYKRINNKKALILADNASDIAISGTGLIDGQGRKLALTVDSLHHIGEMVDPNYNYRRMRPNEAQRPELVNMFQCSRINISGVTMKNASSWVQTYEQCSDMKIDNVVVDSRAYWNNDGFDIVDCKNVSLTNCDVNSADDGICLKSHSADKLNENIYIGNCTVRSSASAVKFGTASYGGFINITIENIKVFDTFRSAIAIESVDGGIIDHVTVSNIIAINTGNALFIRLGHRSGDSPGYVRNIIIRDMYVQVPFGRPDINYDMRGPEVDFFHNSFPAPVSGMPGNRIENVFLENIEIIYPGKASKGMAYIPLSRLEQVPEKIDSYPEFSMFGELPSWGFYFRHAANIEMRNIKLLLDNVDFRPAFVFDDVEGLKMKNITLPQEKKNQIFFHEVTDQKLDKNAAVQVFN